MNKYIYALVESYYDSTSQMNKILKDAKALQKAEEQAKEAREMFIQNILGKSTYRKFDNNGLFAPVPLNALHLTKKDLDDLSMSFDEEKTDKLIQKIQVKYYKNDFDILDDGMGGGIVKTDIVFRTLPEIIDFFYCILNNYKKVYKTEEINWKPIVKKFRNYLH